MRFLLKSLPIITLFASVSVSAQDEIIKHVESNGQWLVQLLFAVVLSLIALTWRTHKFEYAEYKKEREKEMDDMRKRIDDSLRKEDFTRMQSSIHQSLDTLKQDINRWRSEDATAFKRLFDEVYEDIKDQRSEQRRISDEVWKQIESQRDKLGQYEVILARSYHTKEEIARLFDDKIDPVMEQLRKMSKPL